MLSRTLPLLLILLSGNLSAYEFPVEIIEFFDNTKVVAFVNEGDIDKSRYWVPFEGPPPLAVVDALKAIREHIASDPEMTNASLTGIELKQIPHHEKYWHYLVKMRSHADDRLHSSYFIVFMDGKVIPGIREPETLK